MDYETMDDRLIFLYGPPGSGKSTLGSALADKLGLPFTDLDEEIEAREGALIPQIFAARGESGFRRAERAALEAVCRDPEERVVALGGGALLAVANRALAEAHGRVLLLHAPVDVLAERLREDGNVRPLVDGGRWTVDGGQGTGDGVIVQHLEQLLAIRREHYESFPLRVGSDAPLENLLWRAQAALGRFRITGMGKPYEARIQFGGLDSLGEHLTRLKGGGPVAVVSDENVGARYAQRVRDSLRRAGYPAEIIIIPPGEAHKTPETVMRLWEAFLRAGLERGSTVVALGGGVVGDLTGFAAATFLRGIPWVNVPTSLLAMVDAALGGKTGANLPQGKNLAGAFHAPRLVLADPATLSTLPEAELRNGMAEALKHGVIGEAALFARLREGGGLTEAQAALGQAMAVKARVVEADPYEGGAREALNFGHTVGHAVEKASGYRLRHGEAVAIGMVEEARLAERLGVAAPGLAEEIAAALRAWGLPTEIPPEMERAEVERLMRYDKKKRRGTVRFALPVGVGEGVEVRTVDDRPLTVDGGWWTTDR